MQLTLALYAEGATEECFLPILIQRTAEEITLNLANSTVDVLEVDTWHISPPAPKKAAERIAKAIAETQGYHALIIHADADHPTREHALDERIKPGIKRAHADVLDTARLQELVPLIPIKMTEAWMLADSKALREVIGTNIASLGTPERPHQVEAVTNPKQTFAKIVQEATKDRGKRRKIEVKDLYEPLSASIDLSQLRKVPSYQQFCDDFTEALCKLGIVTYRDLR